MLKRSEMAASMKYKMCYRKAYFPGILWNFVLLFTYSLHRRHLCMTTSTQLFHITFNHSLSFKHFTYWSFHRKKGRHIRTQSFTHKTQPNIGITPLTHRYEPFILIHSIPISYSCIWHLVRQLTVIVDSTSWQPIRTDNYIHFPCLFLSKTFSNNCSEGTYHILVFQVGCWYLKYELLKAHPVFLRNLSMNKLEVVYGWAGPSINHLLHLKSKASVNNLGENNLNPFRPKPLSPNGIVLAMRPRLWPCMLAEPNLSWTRWN